MPNRKWTYSAPKSNPASFGSLSQFGETGWVRSFLFASQQKQRKSRTSKGAPKARGVKQQRKRRQGAVPITRTVVAPVSFGRVTRTPAKTAGHPERFEETIGTLDIGTTFGELATIVFNPGLASTFPRLHKIASRYKQYTVNSATLIVRPTAQTGVTGKYVIVPNYAVDPTPPADYIQASNVEGNVTASLWVEASSGLDIKATRATGARKYVRDDETTDIDVAEYDCVTWYIYGSAASEIPDFASVLIKYDITFYVPTIDQTGEAAIEGIFMGTSASGHYGTDYNETVRLSPLFVNSDLTSSSDVMAGFSVSPGNESWTCEEDGIYCLCASVGGWVATNSSSSMENTLAVVVNGEVIVPSLASNYISDPDSTVPPLALASSIYSEIVLPLAKGATVAWDFVTEQFGSHDIGDTMANYINYISAGAELIGALL